MYAKVLDINRKVSQMVVQRISDTAFIPCDVTNSDYKDFIEWQKQDGNAKSIDELPSKAEADGVIAQ